jgi:hypothetical protein
LGEWPERSRHFWSKIRGVLIYPDKDNWDLDIRKVRGINCPALAHNILVQFGENNKISPFEKEDAGGVNLGIFFLFSFPSKYCDEHASLYFVIVIKNILNIVS